MSSGKLYSKYENRIIRYKPAVTKVEEWTSAEMGVGAAIAMGNHGEKGYSALFVMKVRIIKITNKELPVSEEKEVKSLQK